MSQEWVLVLNCGSSSVKLALVDPDSGERRLTALAERVGTSDAVVRLRRGDAEESSAPDDSSARGVVAHLMAALTHAERDGLVGVGHRVVHGGSQFSAAVVIDDATLVDLHDLVDLAPLHMPANLLGIETARAELPDLAQVAVFDTAFHQTMPPVAYRYAVPTDWFDEHRVRRYGFHGTSHRYVSVRAAEMLERPVEDLRLVTLHLGNGCSAAAVRGGESVDTTMGLTPLEGLVMGTRSGDVDPGLLGYIAERLDLDVAGVIEALNTRSGLLGLSGVSNDMRTVCEAADNGSESARLAVDVFCYRAAKSVGALAVALGGLDAVVFTGGIGEHSPAVRRQVLSHLSVLGLAEDPEANADHGRHTGGRVSAPGDVTAIVVPTDEELLIARDTARLAR
ncbi:MAG: acetate kinase [Nocardioides sp.]|uniref:acetate/propionate family kinase n=1 Tax=Nocardioides sp. TaxID=35761 RepID=UPI0032668DB2